MSIDCGFVRCYKRKLFTFDFGEFRCNNSADMSDTKNTSNSTKGVITFLLLLCVYPIGIIVMWYWTAWEKWVKWMVTVPFILVILGGVFVGLTQSLNLNAQVKKGACTKQCENSQLRETCMDQCMGSLNAPPPGYEPR